MNAPQLLTEREAAAAMRVSRARVKALLPRVTLGPRAHRYDAADLRRVIEERKDGRRK